MNDTPSHEPGTPKFLAPDGMEPETDQYTGRFLNDDKAPLSDPDDQGETKWISFDSAPEADSPAPETEEPAPENAAADELPAAAAEPEEPPVEAAGANPLEDFDFSFLDAYAEEKAPEPKAPDAPPTEEDLEFQELFNAKPDEKEEALPLKTHPAKKGRPRNRRGEGLLGIPNILVTIVWIAITLAIGVTLGRMAWVCAADVLAFGREDRQVTVTITPNDTIEDVAAKLHNAGLIRYPGLFKLYASFAVDEDEIKPGIWDLNSLYDYHALVSMMSPSSKRSVVTVMIPEGSNCRQIFELLQDKRVCTVESLESYAKEGDLGDYWFLEGLDRSSKYCLEGYLFPDTYEFYTNDSPQNVLDKLLGNFDKRVDEEIRGQLDALNTRISDMMRRNGRNEDYIAAHQFTMADVITVASLIEKETASADEGYTISSVIYNRLFAWGNTPAFLNIDAAVIYGLDGKSDLTAEDLQIDTPYNTYLNTGLTPGPITNPGLGSIRAALEPQDTDYYYYVLDMETGLHHFSRTLEEHEAFRASNRG